MKSENGKKENEKHYLNRTEGVTGLSKYYNSIKLSVNIKN